MKEKWRGGGRSRLEYVCGVVKMLGLWGAFRPARLPDVGVSRMPAVSPGHTT